jgi:hypothetical protein
MIKVSFAMQRWVFIAALGAACGNSSPSAPAAGSAVSAPVSAASGKGHMSSFALTVVGEDSKVNVNLAVPDSWTAAAADPPSWKMDGARMLSLAAVSPGGSDNASRVEKAIKMQFADLGGIARADYPDGRVWIAHPEGANVHARMFVPYAKGVVMGVAMLSDASKVDAVKAVFETLKLAP